MENRTYYVHIFGRPDRDKTIILTQDCARFPLMSTSDHLDKISDTQIVGQGRDGDAASNEIAGDTQL